MNMTENKKVVVTGGAGFVGSHFVESCLGEGVQPDVLVHLAAIHYIPECEAKPSRAIRMNIEGTQNVLSACVDSVSRVVFASTGAIYDPSVADPLTEVSAIKTGDVYGITKLACEELVSYHAKKKRGNVVIARLFNAVGTRETNPHLIPEIAVQLANGSREIELGNLYPKRDAGNKLN